MSKSARLRLSFNRQSGICTYCHHPMTLEKDRMNSATMDHVIPRAVGGTSASFNLVVACYRCNQIKGAMSLSDFFSSFRPHRFPETNGSVRENNAWKMSNIS